MKIVTVFSFLCISFCLFGQTTVPHGLSLMRIGEGNTTLYLSWNSDTAQKNDFTVFSINGDNEKVAIGEAKANGTGFTFYELGHLEEGNYAFVIYDNQLKQYSNTLHLKMDGEHAFCSMVENTINEQTYLEVKNETQTGKVVIVLFDEFGIMQKVVHQGELKKGINLIEVDTMPTGAYSLKVVSINEELFEGSMVFN